MAQKRPKLVQNMHFWSFWAKYCHFLHILSNAQPKTNVNKVPGWVFRYVGYKTFDFSSKKKGFLPKNDQIWPKIGVFGHFGPGHAGLFSALLVGRLVVVTRGLYLARHLFTLLIKIQLAKKSQNFGKAPPPIIFFRDPSLSHNLHANHVIEGSKTFTGKARISRNIFSES